MKVLVVLCTVMIWKLEALCSEKGHFLNGFGECVKCPDHCQFCSTQRYCSTCEDGYWGNTCELPCSKCYPGTSCEKLNGFCLDKCKDGYTGLLCDAVCDQKCFSCDRMNAVLCDKCAPGLYGETCDKQCSSSCYNLSCHPLGYCIHGCQNGFWGYICEHSCPKNCKDNSCYRQNGTCIFRCDENYTETTCINDLCEILKVNDATKGDGDEKIDAQISKGTIIALVIVGAVLILAVSAGVIRRKKIYSLIRLCNNRKQENLAPDDMTLAKGLVQPEEKKMLKTLKVDYETETSSFLNNGTGFAADRFHMVPGVTMVESRDGKSSKSGKMVVAAIDFGTTYSGYAFSFAHDFARDPAKVFFGCSWDKQCSHALKTPTVLLLDNNKRFVAFGYEAEDTYSDLAAQNIHQSYYYFRRFKIPLYSAGQLRRDMMIPDDNGRQMKAIVVFSFAINYLKKHLLDALNKRRDNFIIL